ncbi:YciI family protein [Dactylosporangium sp. CA-092794]|uniref:YciI family protein n=1 Tax=Dactylosporangium sp. CA-092794 TaxID=3239929 RepID=UPI003D8B676B
MTSSASADGRPVLWAVVTTSLVPWPEIAPRIHEHQRYQEELLANGQLIMSGPWTDQAGRPTGAGLAILRAATSQEAEAIASADPLVRAGLRTVAVNAWKINQLNPAIAAVT